jgi:hypothetical protein
MAGPQNPFRMAGDLFKSLGNRLKSRAWSDGLLASAHNTVLTTTNLRSVNLMETSGKGFPYIDFKFAYFGCEEYCGFDFEPTFRLAGKGKYRRVARLNNCSPADVPVASGVPSLAAVCPKQVADWELIPKP